MATLVHFQSTFTDTAGNVRAGLSVEVRNEATGALAAIYSDKDGNTAKNNPFTTDDFGYGDFYVAQGQYRIQADGLDWRHVPLTSPEAVENAVTEAESARDAAQLNAGIYDDTTDGLANTADGDYFSTPSGDSNEYLILYRNDAGVATEIETYPSAAAVRNGILPWDSSEAYATGDFVSYGGQLWRASVASTNSEPTLANTDWDVVAHQDNFGSLNVATSTGTDQPLTVSLDDRVIRLNSTADFFEGGYDGQRVHVLSRTAPLFPSTHFHGGGTFYWDSASEELVDSGTIFQVSGVSTGRWKRVYNQGDMEAVWFGVIGGGTNVTTEAQSAIDATPIGGTLWLPAFEILVDSLSNPERKNIRGRGWRCPTRAAFGNAAWDDSSGFHGSVVRFTATTGNAFTFGDEVVGSFNFGGSLRDFLLVGPGSGTSVGLYLWDVVSCKMDNMAVANFGFGMDWNFVEDTLFNKFSHWGCDTGLTSHVQGNNENTFSAFEFNRCNTGLVASWGKNNKFFGGLMQHCADRCEVYDTTGAGGGELESWIFEGVWYENDTTMTDNSLIINGDNIELIIHRDCRYDTVSDFSLTAGTNNRGHVFERLRNHTGTMNLTIPSGMARCVVDELYQFDVTDNSHDSILSEDGTFTGTLTGVDTTETGSISYTRYDRTCTLDIPSITGTSNSTTMTITGLPGNLHPQTDSGWAFARVQDSGSVQLGMCRVLSAGSIEFLSSVSGSSFSNSGSKGVQNFTLSYDIT